MNGALYLPLAVSQTPAAHGAQFGGGVVVMIILLLIFSGGDDKKDK